MKMLIIKKDINIMERFKTERRIQILNMLESGYELLNVLTPFEKQKILNDIISNNILCFNYEEARKIIKEESLTSIGFLLKDAFVVKEIQKPDKIQVLPSFTSGLDGKIFFKDTSKEKGKLKEILFFKNV
jgi:hypothetical protein